MTMWLAEAILGASLEPRAVSREPRERAEGQRGAGAEEQGRRGRGEGERRGREVRHPLDRRILDTWPGFRVA